MGRPRNFDPDSVVDRALEVFWTHGYAGTSPARLAAATGVGKGSLYHQYGSKRKLFELVLARYDEIGRERVQHCLAAPGDAREVIREFLYALADSDLAQPIRRGCLVVNVSVELAPHDPEIAAAAHRMQGHTVAALQQRIEQGQRAGEIRADLDAADHAKFLMNTVAGLRITAKTYDAESLHRIADIAVATL
ncbi:TetR/AcrR family transcriptional regulator [Nocardia stercoris]|uniref:TetR/AcrR family transcriptional regulator n=1 Tax=Nocardia stercoris TaxID=2483361 RepID=A0A3M2LCQ8_9NOCA|nr:TetR/AcrR family transcriptional regulator [Nocardia stercoris]RMI35184.1 TetR/AcrR family transcriptional regulator [Nocardia stercoris]